MKKLPAWCNRGVRIEFPKNGKVGDTIKAGLILFGVGMALFFIIAFSTIMAYGLINMPESAKETMIVPFVVMGIGALITFVTCPFWCLKRI